MISSLPHSPAIWREGVVRPVLQTVHDYIGDKVAVPPSVVLGVNTEKADLFALKGQRGG